MLLEGGSDPSQQTCRKKIALYTAAEQGNVELVKLLLPFTKKADLFVETTYGTTPLFIATKSGEKIETQRRNGSEEESHGGSQFISSR